MTAPTSAPRFTCNRASCRAPVTRHGACCSQLCKRILAGVSAIPLVAKTAQFTGGRENLHQAGGLGWLDVRIEGAA